MLASLIVRTCVVALAHAGAHARGESAPRDAARDSAAVEQVAATYAASQILSAESRGHVALDPRDAFGRPRPAERQGELEHILGARTTALGFSKLCPSGPSSCRLDGFAAMVRVRVIALTDSLAQVNVEVVRPTSSPRVPLWTFEPTLLLERTRQGWQFLRMLRVRES